MLLQYVACVTEVQPIYYVVRFILILKLESVWAMPVTL